MRLGIVIPTYNRLENLKIVLESIKNQTFRDFFIVISDDGSSDGTKEYINRISNEKKWKGKLKWVGCGKNTYMRAGRTKNIGIANLPSDIEAFISLDSDVILKKNALEKYDELTRKYPDTVIFGQVDWLPPELNLSKLDQNKSVIIEDFIKQGVPERIEGTFVGKEIRLFADFTKLELQELVGKWALFLNTLIPRKAFDLTSGYDENMKGYGYNDMEFGMQLEKLKLKCIYTCEPKGYHIWHKKDTSRLLENQRNLDYFLVKHGFNEYYYTAIDWTYWWHYSYRRSGILAKLDSNYIVLSFDKKHFIRLKEVSWLRKLGYQPQDLSNLEIKSISDIHDHGYAEETTVDKWYYNL